MKVRVAVGVSGGGRSLSNLLQVQNNFAFDIVGVIATNPLCTAKAIAERANLPLFLDSFGQGDDSVVPRLRSWLEHLQVNYVALAGFIKRFPLLSGWESAVVNIHPALLPSYGGPGMYGDRVHKAVLDAGNTVSGATIHYVNGDYDKGRILAQTKVPILAKDTIKSLSDRVFAAECQLYPVALDALARGELPLETGVKFYEF